MIHFKSQRITNSYPRFLVNGASGIAVGMATNMPPHNFTEVVDGTIAYIDNNDIEIDELITHVKLPIFQQVELFMVMMVLKKLFILVVDVLYAC